MDIQIPDNEKLLHYLTRNGEAVSLLNADQSTLDPYRESGSHPDVVERLWNVMGASLGQGTNWLLHGQPALIHPRSGLVFALAFGTAYILRVPANLVPLVRSEGYSNRRSWSDGTKTDLAAELGDDWFFGNWSAVELEWINEAYAPF